MHKTKDEFYQLVKDIISQEKFDDLIETRKRELGELVDDEALAYLIVDEMGRNVSHLTPIDSLKAGDGASFYAVVTRVNEPYSFVKNGNRGIVVNIEVYDGTGRCRLVLWDDDVELVRKNDISRNTVLKIVNGYVRHSKYGLEVNLGKWGMLVVGPEDAPPMEHLIFTPLMELKLGMMGINVRGDVTEKTRIRTFKRADGSEGCVTNLTVDDGTAKARIVAWDESAERCAALQVGDHVELFDAYTKSKNGLEIHAGKYTSLVIKPAARRS